MFTLAVEEKPKRENFYLLVLGGGVRVSPRKFLKNGCKWCIRSPFLPSSCRFFPKKLCVIFAFKSPIFYIRDVGKFLSSRSRGGGSGSPRENF